MIAFVYVPARCQSALSSFQSSSLLATATPIAEARELTADANGGEIRLRRWTLEVAYFYFYSYF